MGKLLQSFRSNLEDEKKHSRIEKSAGELRSL